MTTLPVRITLEGGYHNYKLRGKRGRSRLKYRNLELAGKGKRYPLYIFLPSEGSGDCAEASGSCAETSGGLYRDS